MLEGGVFKINNTANPGTNRYKLAVIMRETRKGFKTARSVRLRKTVRKGRKPYLF